MKNFRDRDKYERQMLGQWDETLDSNEEIEELIDRLKEQMADVNPEDILISTPLSDRHPQGDCAYVRADRERSWDPVHYHHGEESDIADKLISIKGD